MAVSETITTDWFRVNYFSLWPDNTVKNKIGVKLYTRTPVFTDNSAAKFASIKTTSELSKVGPEWVPAVSTVVAHTGASTTADLYLKRITDSDNQYLQLGAGSTWAVVNVESKGGFYLTPTSPATEFQEIISAAVFYLIGTITGVDGVSVTNPVLFATKWGIGDFCVARNGSIYGQTSYAFSNPDNAYTLALNVKGFGSSSTITTVTRSSNVSTATTSSAHGLGVGDVVVIAGVTNTSFNTTALVKAPLTATTFSYSNSGTNGSSTGGSVTLQSSKFSHGHTFLKLSAPEWEPAHAQHLWLEPQRVNFIANPSFEEGTDCWRCSVESDTSTSSATISRYQNGLNPHRPYVGHVSGGGDEDTALIAESNLFPRVSAWASVTFSISGGDDGAVFNYGLVAYPSDYGQSVYIKSDDIILSQGTGDSGFNTFSALIPIPDDVREAQFRIEYYGTEFWIDDVLVDPHESQYNYFDGNSNDSLDDDYHWMGGTDYANKHFSMWYNNFQNTSSRLIGGTDDNGNYVNGLTNEWIPNGTTVIAHWNAVTSVTPYNWVGDAFYPISNFPSGALCSVPDSALSFLLTPFS